MVLGVCVVPSTPSSLGPGGSKPEGAEEAGPGWINLRELARQLGSTEEEVKRAWRPLAAHLR